MAAYAKQLDERAGFEKEIMKHRLEIMYLWQIVRTGLCGTPQDFKYLKIKLFSPLEPIPAAIVQIRFGLTSSQSDF